MFTMAATQQLYNLFLCLLVVSSRTVTAYHKLRQLIIKVEIHKMASNTEWSRFLSTCLRPVSALPISSNKLHTNQFGSGNNRQHSGGVVGHVRADCVPIDLN